MLIPLADKVIILAFSDPDKWYGSSLIVRPDSTKDRADSGIIKAVGPGVQDLKIGDFVVFSPYDGMVINDSKEGWKHVMVREEKCAMIVIQEETPIPNVVINTTDGPLPATSEMLFPILREVFQNLPRVVELKQKWEDRNKI